MRKGVLGLLLTLVFICSVQAESPVWKVVKGKNVLFIGGTIHVLSPSDYPLPAAFDSAYAKADKVVFETDIQSAKKTEFKTAVFEKLIYTDGRTLKTVLNKETYQNLEAHLLKRGIPISGVANFKPGMISMTLVAIEMKRLGLLGGGVDEFFSLKAEKDQKAIGQLENLEDQISFLSAMGEGVENEIINHTLLEMDKLPDLLQVLKDIWRTGDNDKFMEIASKPFMKDFPQLYSDLIVKRNNAWLQKIESMLETKEVEFILVGAMHLAGKDGILKRLEIQGCDITQLK